MIDAKTAVSKAYGYFQDLYSDKAPGKVLLEEVELTDDQSFWLITLSHDTPIPNLAQLMGSSRAYKIFKIDANSGEVRSMKIRTIK